VVRDPKSCAPEEFADCCWPRNCARSGRYVGLPRCEPKPTAAERVQLHKDCLALRAAIMLKLEEELRNAPGPGGLQ
jgi:hypothetical protein